jgi:phospholipid/cholesterol/gamma-HCH transport system permease protein
MSDTRRLVLEQTETGGVLRLAGDWRLANLAALDKQLTELKWPRAGTLTLDGSRLVELDSAGVMLLYRRLQAAGFPWQQAVLTGFDPERQPLIQMVTGRLDVAASPAPVKSGWLAALGRRVSEIAATLPGAVGFLGWVSDALFESLWRPGRFRGRETVVQLEAAGLRALPIVALMTFLIGVVFAYLLGIQIEKYGANIFIVDGVAMAMARELSPLLVAILMAGRSGAAFTAQIGAMKVTEEIDAITTLGLSPMQVLVIPRLIAIVIAMPLLTFFGDVVGLAGSAVVAASQLDITFYTFIGRLKDVLPLDSVIYGLVKAPAFAAAIAFIACRNGFAVSRDARSVGERTTSTVVASLVAVILINALFAILHPEVMG